ncbi:Arylsulphatase [Gonapodya prolifera JEL478]|uniref:Arylsulphatase n=1 Tax=Gonapodya prolifera (strain JEL478) TaxID=1344416 RepID=A0A139AY53_GONPJ|nr:Arylsulphatase [Gonapodya prolifera JEL478]|eukprot:KXS21503.1 Arylsulphatase [Gonapodya prolifera JEL478]
MASKHAGDIVPRDDFFRPAVRRFALVAIALLLFSFHFHSWFDKVSVKPPSEKLPNIIFIITDDQDALYDSLEYMPLTQKHLVQKGANFVNHHVTTPVCCPSRTSVLRSQFVHNHNLTDVFPPHGGYTKFRKDNLDNDYLPLWLKKAGYQTFFTGKFVVEYALTNYKTVPKGWDVFDGLIWPWTFDYLFPVFSLDGGWPRIYWGAHQSDVIIEKTESFLKTALKKKDQPFFIYTAPAACHTTIKVSALNFTDPNAIKVSAPVPLPRHAHLFPNVTVPRTPNFNEPDFSKKPLWMLDIPLLSDHDIDRLDEAYRQRLRTLQGVDELVDKVVTLLEEAGELENTYIFYTTDNGYHLGAHRLGMGKEFPYEEDIRVPLIVRGPGIKMNTVVNDLTLHVDLAATFTALAGQGVPRISDGKPLPLFDGFVAKAKERSVFPIEFWEEALDELTGRRYPNNTWKAVKIETESGTFKYVVRCSGDYELYDLRADPYEINNLLPPRTDPSRLPAFLTRIANRADAFLSILALCKRTSCTDPFSVLRNVPGGISVTSFEEALSEEHDAFFAGLAKFKFKRCLNHYEIENEESFAADLVDRLGWAKALGLVEKGHLKGTTLDGHNVKMVMETVEQRDVVVGPLERRAEALPEHLATMDLTPLYEAISVKNFFK